MFTYLLHSFGLAAAQIEIWFLPVSLLTIAHKHWEEHDLILYFHFLLSWQKTEVLICGRYVDADSQRYSYKDMLQNYEANLHKGVLAGAFPHKLNACPFYYTTDCAALFSLT